jgi:NAD(P)-dependent dehydrogenase (short-subunit alcohol dehydrogenase family)
VSDLKDGAFRLDGKVTVVTGASKNVSLEIARTFAAVGAEVVMVARAADRLAGRAAEIWAQSGASVTPVAADVTSRADTDELMSRVLDVHSQVDVLVNNAYASGETFGRHVLDVGDDAWEITFRANVLARSGYVAGSARACWPDTAATSSMSCPARHFSRPGRTLLTGQRRPLCGR